MAWLSVLGLYQYDPTIFDPMELPDQVDKTTMISTILSECAEMECVLPDANVFKTVIHYWSKKNSAQWQKMMDALDAEYNPLYNKDAYFEDLETRDLHSTGESTGKVSAYNSSSFQNANKSNAEGSDYGTVDRKRREYGNIGVTTSQQMLQSEIELRQEWNMYDIILEDFKSRFCILVY